MARRSEYLSGKDLETTWMDLGDHLLLWNGDRMRRSHRSDRLPSVHTFGVPSLITTVVCCVIIVLVILGGLGALVKVTDKLVPAMAMI